MCHTNDALTRAAETLKQHTPRLEQAELETLVGSFLDRRDVFLESAARDGSPLYILEEEVLLQRADEFVGAFRAELPDVRVYFALKSNNHPFVAATLVGAGLGLDVSSGVELELALSCGAKDIVFSGPGKTDAELSLAVEHRDRVTVLMDSSGEMERLERIAGAAGVTMRTGVRLTTDERGLWRKFGIPLAELPGFLHSAQKCRSIQLRGLQFHTSWNLTPAVNIGFIQRLGATLQSLDSSQRAMIEFVDIGGGFWPPYGEWLQPAGTPEGQLRQAAGVSPGPPTQHHKLPAASIREFAHGISAALQQHLFPHVRCRICIEPGRWICSDAMHILLTVVDRKAGDIVITDGGTNAIGWERFETDYFPVINLSRPERTERECMILGSLCTPHDVWGYSYFGKDIQPGDRLLIPKQGAYTYSLRQNFIKPLPNTSVVPPKESIRPI